MVKLGLVAPFEGYHRPLGYRLLPQVRDTIAAWNQTHRVAEVRIVALDDHLDPGLAADRVRQLAADPDVLAVVGPWSQAAFLAAQTELEGQELPALVPVVLEERPPSRWAFLLGPTSEEVARAAAQLLWSEAAAGLQPVGGPLARRVAELAGLPVGDGPGRGYAFLDLNAAAAADWLTGPGRTWPRERVLGGPDLHSEKLLQLAGRAAVGVRVLAWEGSPSPLEAQARRATEVFLAVVEDGARDRQAVRQALAALDLAPPPLRVYEVHDLDYPSSFQAR